MQNITMHSICLQYVPITIITCGVATIGSLKGQCQGHCQSIRMLNCLQRSSQYQLTKFITVIDALHFSIAQIPSKTDKNVCVYMVCIVC